ncbi:MAG: hypothetical protein NT059_11605 [Planctomycetota bacterium]|nr:hypothetical protein [Planctomycetota bacterium]
MRTEQTRHRARSAFASSHARRLGIRSVLAGVRAVIVASAATIAPVAHGIVLQAQGASQAAPTVDPAVVARIRALKAEASRLQQQRQTVPALGEESKEMQRRIEQITADVSGMPETEWTTWVMPFPSVLGRVAKDPSQPRSTATYISEAVRRAEARVRGIGFGDVDFTVSNNLSEVVVRGERWMVALAVEAMREEVEHVWNRVGVMDGERIALEAQERENKASEARAGLIRLDWAGGTLQDFVKAVQGMAPQQPVNVVLLDDDAAVNAVKIAPISVRDVTPTALFRSLVHLAPEGSQLIVTVTGDMAAAAGDAESGARDAGRATGAPIITIRARRTVGAAEAAAKAAQPSVVVIDLSVYLLSADGENIEGGPAKERLDRLMDAVGAALALDDRPVVAAQLRIHAPTGLLFVKGDEVQVSLVNEVINCIAGQ